MSEAAEAAPVTTDGLKTMLTEFREETKSDILGEVKNAIETARGERVKPPPPVGFAR